MSTRTLRYYKNKMHAISYLTRPIAAMPLQIVDHVKIIELPEKYKRKRDEDLYDYMFEVVLMRDFEDFYFFRETEELKGKAKP